MVTTILHTETPPIDPRIVDAEESRVRDLCREWICAVTSRDREAIGALLAERCVLIPPNGGSIKGREAVVEAWARIFQMSGFHIAFEPDRVNLYPTGDIAHDVGSYRLTLHGDQDGAGCRHDHGNHLLVWEKADGEWRIRSNVFYSRGFDDFRLLG